MCCATVAQCALCGSVHTFLNCTPGYSVASCSNVSLSVSSGSATSTTFRPWSARRFARDLPMPVRGSRVHQVGVVVSTPRPFPLYGCVRAVHAIVVA